MAGMQVDQKEEDPHVVPEGSAPESSQAAQRRYDRHISSTASISCCASPTATIDPFFSQLIYLAPSGLPSGHLITPIVTPRQTHPLPTPKTLNPGRQISVSPDGLWVVIFHPNLPVNNNNAAPTNTPPYSLLESSTGSSRARGTDLGGTLAIYPSTLLSPLAIISTVQPLATFVLPSEPLAIHQLHSTGLGSGPRSGSGSTTARQWTKSGRSPPRGPRLFHPGHAGPAFVILLSSGIILCYPQAYVPDGMDGLMPLGSASASTSSVNGSTGASTNLNHTMTTWRMGMLQCPLHTRWRTTAAEANAGLVAPDIGVRAKRGWMGSVPGDQAVWVAYEDKKEVKVVRVEMGIDATRQTYMGVTPMSGLPRFQESAAKQEIELQGVAFIPLLKDTLQGVKKEEGSTEQESSSSSTLERVGMVLVSRQTDQDTSKATHGRSFGTRLVTVGFERRLVELAEGFKDIDPNAGETISSWDWFTVPKPITTSASPSGFTILSLHPLPDIPPHTLALALINTPTGLVMSHLDLASTTTSDRDSSTSAGWSALVGQQVTIRDDLDTSQISLIISQGPGRGGFGLVGMVSPEIGAVLMVSPRIEAFPTPQDGLVDSRNMIAANDAASSIILALKQDVDWSDVIRAALGSVPKGQRSDFIDNIARAFFTLAEGEQQIDEIPALLRVQTALYSAANDSRLRSAAELVHLKSAVNLFTRCAITSKSGKIRFDLESIWPLISVAEWVSSVLGRTAREAVLERARYEWEGTDTAPENTSRLIYLLHPALRSIILRLHAQLYVFVNYVHTLEQAIPPPLSAPGSGVRDVKSTILARGVVKDVMDKEGIELVLWGRALESMAKTQLETPNRVTVTGTGNGKAEKDTETEDEGPQNGQQRLPNGNTGATATSGSGEDVKMDLTTHSPSTPEKTTTAARYHTALMRLSIDPIISDLKHSLSALPNPSSLFTAPYFLSEDEADLDGHNGGHGNGNGKSGIEYDAITFEKLEPLMKGKVRISCIRCGWRTMALGRGVTPAGHGAGPGAGLGVNAAEVGGGGPEGGQWRAWRMEREKSCACGGAWTVEAQK